MSPNPSKPDIMRIRTEIQRIIRSVMGDHQSEIPDDIPIFDLGISSLALVEGMRQVYDQFGVLVSIRRVIEGQITIGTLALYIEQELKAKPALKNKAATAAAQRKIESQIALAPSQQNIGFLCRYSNEAGAAYNEAIALQMRGALHGSALQAALEEVSSRYDALRTALSPYQNVFDLMMGEPLELTVTAINHDQLGSQLAAIVSRPFEIGQRLFRAEVLRLSEHEHVFVLVSHALVLEQKALEFILNDIAALYGAFAKDQPTGDAPLALQWTDYLALHSTEEYGTARSKAEIYWQNIYAAGVPRLELPSDRPRPLVKRYTGARLEIPLPGPLTRKLRAFALQSNQKPETVLSAAFTAYIHRLSGANDFILGIEGDSLYLEKHTPAIANTRDMLPVRAALPPQLSFGQHLRTHAQELEQANQHRHISLFELIQMLQIERDQSRSPLFTTAFRAYTSAAPPKFWGLESDYRPLPASGARYDLDLTVHWYGDDLKFICDYSTELFESETITRWLQGLTAYLDAALQNPNQACSQLSMLTPDERQKILVDWNQTGRPYPQDQTVLDLIIQQAHSSPHAPALHFGEQTLNYQQVISRSKQISLALHNQGVRPGERVGILLPRSLDLVPALLAAWQLGAMFVPLDITSPKKRLAYMLADSGVQTILTSRQLQEPLEAGAAFKVLRIEDLETGSHPELEQTTPANGWDSAHIIYTSGSTGHPKGVEICHNALLNCLLATRDYLEFSPGDRMLAMTTITFDISANELFMPLIAGGSVDLGEDGLVADALKIREHIENREPSHLQATPSTWKTILMAGWQGDPDVTLVSTGEALNRELAEELLLRCKNLWNLYGPSETTVFSAACQVKPAKDQPISIGFPLPNTQMYVLDDQFQPLPAGAVGNLYIAGDGLARGYWQKPELTAERFISNPFIPGERMYSTGDLARYQPDGSLICLGRVDDQVKIHGVRIELGEVEAALRRIPGLKDTVVVSRQDSRGDDQLVGHVILEPEASLTSQQIKAQLRTTLPEVMIPPHILFSKVFPQTPNGKVQRSALPSPDQNAASTDQPIGEPPATPTEQAVARLWASLLGIETHPINRDSDFMDLGGHSLLMTVLMIEIRKLFQVSFSLREFFDAMTVREFAALIDELRKQTQHPSNGNGRPDSTRTSEWARQRMAFLQREAELPRYITPARGLHYRPVAELQNVLLTGATGFLGAYLVAEILNKTQANLYCLVRPKRGQDSKARIQQQMQHYQVWEETEGWQAAWQQRLKIVEGDITLPRLAIEDSVYETLARELDAILHGAAHVNFIYPYEALRATNVLGIHELIQFAFHARIKPVHHLSTAAIWPMGSQYTYYENDPIDHLGPLNLGYDEAKWVGEKTLLHAEQRGLPLARYRPGEVGGDSTTGRCVTDHFLIACFKGFLQFGIFPDLDIEVDIAPVDYVAQAMVHLAFKGDSLGHAFHLTNPSRRHLANGLAYLSSVGYQFDTLPFEQLRDQLVSSPEFANNALFAYQAALDEMDNISMQLPTYDTQKTQKALAGSGITCPPADEKLFSTYLRYLQESGFIPQPEALLARS